MGRDRNADGSFVYGVQSTRIFCRPSCPSRRPRRDRVRFFDKPDEASRAGFRACRRCRPLDAPVDAWAERVARACAFISRHDEPVPLATLARIAGASRHHFLRNFKRILGVTPREFAAARRFATVKQRLRTAADVTEALFDAGYGSSSRFYEGAVPRLGMTPTAYRDGAPGQTIRFAASPSPLGRLLVATTARGVCAVSLGDRDEDLIEALKAEFPEATLVSDRAALRGALDQILDHLSGRTPRIDLPLDLRATAFQWQVWNALRAIPRGERQTYGDVARAIDRPGAARAVARACATNPVALAIPCHRVVPASGETGGYRWGAARKEKLLARESGVRPSTPRADRPAHATPRSRASVEGARRQ
jgi:AraC family transcriptional regulator of adaptative response/methylated-DNA-[protein]-cysteine methyltransferase